MISKKLIFGSTIIDDLSKCNIDRHMDIQPIHSVGAYNIGFVRQPGITNFTITVRGGSLIDRYLRQSSFTTDEFYYDDREFIYGLRIMGSYSRPVTYGVFNIFEAMCGNMYFNDGIIYLDEQSVWSGTDYPIGVAAMPVNNIDDAIRICEIRQFQLIQDSNGEILDTSMYYIKKALNGEKGKTINHKEFELLL